jgi:hypothetical protein
MTFKFNKKAQSNYLIVHCIHMISKLICIVLKSSWLLGKELNSKSRKRNSHSQSC